MFVSAVMLLAPRTKKRQLQRGTYVAESLTHEKVIATTVLPMQTCRIPLSLDPLSLVSIC